MRIVLSAIVMCLAVATAGYSETSETVVTFTNDGEGEIFVRTASGSGECGQKTVSSVFSLPPGHRKSISDGGNAVCYVYSRFEQPGLVPFGSGEASPGELVRLSIGPGLELLDFEYSIVGEKMLVGEKRGRIFIPNGEPEIFPQDRPPRRPQPDAAGGRPVVDETLARYIDPLTPPKLRNSCAKWARGRIPFDGEWKTCIGWKTEFKCMENRWVVIATGPDGYGFGDLTEDLKECAATSAVAAAVAALVSGGSAAAPTATEAFKLCLSAKVGGLVAVRIENHSGWTEWGGCY